MEKLSEGKKLFPDGETELSKKKDEQPPKKEEGKKRDIIY